MVLYADKTVTMIVGSKTTVKQYSELQLLIDGVTITQVQETEL